MDTFNVVQVKPEPDPEWAVQWTEAGKSPHVVPRRFQSETDAQRWADRLRAIAGTREQPPAN